VSHDTDKLIRQLSLVAFLMAERRPITARDVKQNVEGYSEMSDEAFARRYYSDRAELTALGVPLHSQRDEFTGEELYTLRSEQYFLPPLELSDEELAALQTSLYLLEGKFAYAEPLRLALQNLALGRPGFDEPRSQTAVAVEVKDPDYTAEMPGRLGKLEGAIAKQRTVRFRYWALSRDEERERSVNPYGLFRDPQGWYLVGHDLDRQDLRMFKVSRIRSDIRFATRRERDFRVPPDFDVDEFRGRPEWQIGDHVGEARIEVAPDTAWWVQREYGGHGRLKGDVFVTPYSSLELLAAWVLRQDGRAKPIEPDELRREVARALRAVRDAHEGSAPVPAPERPPAEVDGTDERPAAPVTPERFGLLQALLAYLLDACGEDTSARIPAAELVERFHIPHEELQEHLSLLNLVNFGGGCYAVYAQLEGDVVRVDKELWGDTFRASPRLTPLEARAIQIALEFVGPMIAATAQTPLERVRSKLAETFGRFDLAHGPDGHLGSAEEKLVGTLSRAIDGHRLVEIEYQKEGEGTWSKRLIEPYSFERELPRWYVHSWDRTRDAARSFRLDRMRGARITKERFEPRPEFDPDRYGGTRVVRILHTGQAAPRAVERDALPLADGNALQERLAGDGWAIEEILSLRGESILLEPTDLRKNIARRARELAHELGVSGLRVAR
jgi:predicted DNA-binding transcriptional regulator YafY